MTVKEYKRICRMKIGRLVRLIKYLILIAWFIAAEYFNLHYAVATIIGIWVWEYIPSYIAIVLEKSHKISHDWVKWD